MDKKYAGRVLAHEIGQILGLNNVEPTNEHCKCGLERQDCIMNIPDSAKLFYFFINIYSD